MALQDDEEGKAAAQRPGPLCSHDGPFGDLMAPMYGEEGDGSASGDGAKTPAAEKRPELRFGFQKNSKVRDVAPYFPV